MEKAAVKEAVRRPLLSRGRRTFSWGIFFYCWRKPRKNDSFCFVSKCFLQASPQKRQQISISISCFLWGSNLRVKFLCVTFSQPKYPVGYVWGVTFSQVPHVAKKIRFTHQRTPPVHSIAILHHSIHIWCLMAHLHGTNNTHSLFTNSVFKPSFSCLYILKWYVTWISDSNLSHKNTCNFLSFKDIS